MMISNESLMSAHTMNGSIDVNPLNASSEATEKGAASEALGNLSFLELHSNATHILNDLNSTLPGEADAWKHSLKLIMDYLMIVTILTLMLAMGCEMTCQSLAAHLKKPWGLCVGMVSQFVVLPLSAFGILAATGVTGLQATGVLIISCCPAGMLSNTYTYFCDGDVSLSVAMTTASTVMAMGMMPANIWLYGRHFARDSLVVPYAKLALSLLSVTSPVALGMLLRWKWVRAAGLIGKFGSCCGMLAMIANLTIEIIVFPNSFVGLSPKLYIVVVCLPLIGLTLGYSTARVLKSSIPVQKTIAIECGIQNLPVALATISMSFPYEVQEEVAVLPWIYGIGMTTGSAVICIIYHIHKRMKGRGEFEGTESTGEKDLEESLMDMKDSCIQLKPASNGEQYVKVNGHRSGSIST